ncbi:DUF2059 domain-containing protein [Maricaulis sp. MIT060901]|uniref:DUF2059 domain-containing protein n=1 Tax=Maricaulis sp. MIT060901 TaxID=3096993 RepID=UPI00399AA555
MRNLIIGIAFAFIAFVPRVQADDASDRLVIAREIVLQSTSEDMYRTALETTMPLIRNSFQVSIPGATDAQLDEAMDLMMEIMMSTYDDMIEESAGLYASRFTLAELEELQAFNSTPLGQKVLQELPGITSEASVIGERLGTEAVNANLGRVQAIFQ